MPLILDNEMQWFKVFAVCKYNFLQSEIFLLSYVTSIVDCEKPIVLKVICSYDCQWSSDSCKSKKLIFVASQTDSGLSGRWKSFVSRRPSLIAALHSLTSLHGRLSLLLHQTLVIALQTSVLIKLLWTTLWGNRKHRGYWSKLKTTVSEGGWCLKHTVVPYELYIIYVFWLFVKRYVLGT